MKKLTSIFLLSIALFCACKTPESNIEGEVFIVTQGRDNIKLAGTNVFAIPNKEAAEFFNQKTLIDKTPKKDGEFYFSGLPLPKASAITDSDGKYKMTVPAGEYVIVARDSRKVFDKTEYYYWFVKVKAESDTKLSLSNNNMATASGIDSVVKIIE